MSLLAGMNNLFENTDAIAAAEEEMAFQDLLDLETDIVIEALTSKGKPFNDDDDEIAKMVEEDELDEEEYQEVATEAAALTGLDFINSIVFSDDKMTDTGDGSLGPKSSAANHATNVSDESTGFKDNIDTKPGSLGPESSSASHDQNYSAELPFKTNGFDETHSGSYGQKDTATSNDKVVESALLFGELTGTEVAMEGVISKLRGWTQNQKNKKYMMDCSIAGVQPLDTEKVDKLIADGKCGIAIQVIERNIKAINVAKESANGDKKKLAAAKRLARTMNSLVVGVQTEKIVQEEMKRGLDRKEASKIAIVKMAAIQKKMTAQKKLDKASEAAIDMALEYHTAVMESIGDDDARANHTQNYSDGALDNDDPFDTSDDDVDGVGDGNAHASFDDNFGGGSSLDGDIDAGDGSVGQDDSTAKDPASEALTALEELEALTLSYNDPTYD